MGCERCRFAQDDMAFDSIKFAVEEAGFFTSYDTDFGRLICASMLRSDGGLTGNSFWIAERAGYWFLGTWGSHVYQIPKGQQAPELCIMLLSYEPHGTATHIEGHVRRKFGLVELDSLPER